MNITIIKYLLIVGILFSSGFGVAWKLRTGTINEIKLEIANADILRNKESFRQFELDSQKKSAAQTNKVTRDAKLLVDSDRAINAGNGLRIASTDTVRAAKENAATCLASVTLYDRLLGTMVEAGGRIAREADAWESDAIAQHEAAK